MISWCVLWRSANLYGARVPTFYSVDGLITEASEILRSGTDPVGSRAL